MKMKFVFAALMGLLPVQSFAGVEHGNGGGVIICQNNPKIELLDFYEQRQLYKLTLDQGYGSESDYKKIAKFWLAKHAGIAIFREALWGKFVDEFESHVEWLDGVTLGETNDVGGAIIPAGCKFELAVIQETPSEIRPRRFYVNRDIWSRLEPAQRAGLVLHESVYREALLYGHDNSKVTRYFVSIWTSVGIYKDLASRVLLNQLLQRNHFLAGDFDGCTPELYRHTKLPNGSLLPDWNQPLETYWRFDGYWSNSSIFSDIPIELMSRHGELKANCLEVKYWKSDLLSRILQPVQGEWGNGILKVRVEPDFDTATSRFEVTKNFVAEDQSATGYIVKWPSILTVNVQGQYVQSTEAYFSNKDNLLLSLLEAINFRKLKGHINNKNYLYTSKPGVKSKIVLHEDGLIKFCTDCIAEEVY